MKSIVYYARSLHRDIGFLMLGLTLAYALSGVILVYRETDFLKKQVIVQQTWPLQMSSQEIAGKLHARRFEVTGVEGDILKFQDGTNLKDGVYNRGTGEVSYLVKEFPVVVDRIIRLHKLSGSKMLHYLGVSYGVLLMFLAISALGMFKSNTTAFRRGAVLSCGGLVLAGGVLFLV